MNIFKKKKKQISIGTKRPERNPFRFWKIALLTFFGLVIVSIGFHIFMFYKINQEQFFEVKVTDVEPPPELEKEKLDQILDRFEERERRTDILRGDIDPGAETPGE